MFRRSRADFGHSREKRCPQRACVGVAWVDHVLGIDPRTSFRLRQRLAARWRFLPTGTDRILSVEDLANFFLVRDSGKG